MSPRAEAWRLRMPRNSSEHVSVKALWTYFPSLIFQTGLHTFQRSSSRRRKKQRLPR